MELHRVRRLTEILITSQLRSGRSSSDPTSVLGRPAVLAVADAAAFLAAFALTNLVVGPSGLTAATLAAVAEELGAFVPLLTVSVVLVAGVMFELTATAKFSGSDAANWLPLSPAEYVAASASAIAYTYAPGSALLLGALGALALRTGTLAAFALTVLLCAVALFEGGLLVEMVRSVTQRAGSLALGRGGRLTFVVRAAVLAAVILAVELLTNPVLLLPTLRVLSSASLVAVVVPFLWSTESVLLWTRGLFGAAAAYAVGQVAFVGALVYIAGALRVRFWVPSPAETRFESRGTASGHPYLTALGLTPAEAALVSKDLRGFTRRRELAPMLVLPIVFLVLAFLNGPGLGGVGGVLWAGWVGGFFALLIAATSVGQERRSLLFLYALPVAPSSIARAKAVSVLVPALLVSIGTSALMGYVVHLPAPGVGGALLLAVGATVALAFWGLVFASRFSDFQERPRPQYLRPAAMLGAIGSGMLLLFAIVVPGALVIVEPGVQPIARAAIALAATLGTVVVGIRWARTGFERLFRELPF